MDKKKIIWGYQLAVIVPLVAVSALSLITGTPIISTPMGLLCTIALLIACLVSVNVAMKRKVADTYDRLADKYNHECDPDALLKQGGKAAFDMMKAREDDSPLGDTDAWFLSLYGLACVDMGSLESAEKIGAAILEDAPKQKESVQCANMLANVEPLVFRLRGAEEALAVLERASALLTGDTSAQANGVRNYVEFETRALNAILEGDQETMRVMFEHVYRDNRQPMRLRVLGADTCASIYRAQGNEGDELAALTFVDEHGNNLPVRKAAEERLDELFN